jgi:hypothetical protein
MTWAAVGIGGSAPIGTSGGCGCDGCAEPPPPRVGGTIGPLTWVHWPRKIP